MRASCSRPKRPRWRLKGVAAVGHPAQLVQDAAGNDQVADEEAALGHVGEAAVNDGAGVDHNPRWRRRLGGGGGGGPRVRHGAAAVPQGGEEALHLRAAAEGDAHPHGRQEDGHADGGEVAGGAGQLAEGGGEQGGGHQGGDEAEAAQEDL